jgi:hypothetical protein
MSVTVLSCYLFLHFLVSKTVTFRLLSKLFCVALSLFALLSSVRHCSVISARNSVPARLYSVGWHGVCSSCCGCFVEGRKDVVLLFYYTCLCVCVPKFFCVFLFHFHSETHTETHHMQLSDMLCAFAIDSP